MALNKGQDGNDSFMYIALYRNKMVWVDLNSPNVNEGKNCHNIFFFIEISSYYLEIAFINSFKGIIP
jgi:hypothetical protein